MASSAPLNTRLGPGQWRAIDAAVSVAWLAVLVGLAVSRHFRQSGGERTLALLLLAPLASLPLAVRRVALLRRRPGSCHSLTSPFSTAKGARRGPDLSSGA